MSPEEYQTCFLQLFISQLASENQSYREALIFFFNLLHRLRQIFAEMIPRLKDSHSKEEYASLFKVLFIYFFFINI